MGAPDRYRSAAHHIIAMQYKTSNWIIKAFNISLIANSLLNDDAVH